MVEERVGPGPRPCSVPAPPAAGGPLLTASWPLAVGVTETGRLASLAASATRACAKGPRTPNRAGSLGPPRAQFIAEPARGSPGQGQAPWASRELVIPSAPQPHLLSRSPVISINPSCPD